MSVLGPLLAPYDPQEQQPLVGLTQPSPEHWFGTDEFGRDIFSRIVWGARLSLLVGIAAVSISVIGGTLLGIVSGYFRGATDTVIMRNMDVLLSFPGLTLALAISAIIGTGLVAVIIAVGIAGIPNFARVARGATLSASNEDYVLAARSIGCKSLTILRWHILPNIAGPLIVLATLYLAFAVLTSASLSFLGLGVQPPTPEWGAMANAGRHLMVTGWWVSTFPSLMIVTFVIGVNLVGDALRDSLDVTLTRS